MALSRAQHDAIMRIYNDRELKAQRDLDARIAEVYSKSPEFEAIDKEIARKSLDYQNKTFPFKGYTTSFIFHHCKFKKQETIPFGIPWIPKGLFDA